jgi:hypothetical protein
LSAATRANETNGQQNSDIMLKAMMKPLPLRWDEHVATLASNAALNALGENHV